MEACLRRARLPALVFLPLGAGVGAVTGALHFGIYLPIFVAVRRGGRSRVPLSVASALLAPAIAFFGGLIGAALAERR